MILATWETEIGRIVVPGQPGEKVQETPSQPMARCGSECLLFQLCLNWKDHDQDWPGHKARP
jgi:hypothetical protein